MFHAKPVVLPLRLAGLTRETVAPAAAAPPPAPTPAPLPDPVLELARERQQVMQTLAGLTAAARNFRAAEEQPLHELQRLAIELGLAVACRLTHRALEAGDVDLEGLVRGALERLRSREAVTLHLHPADLALLQERHGDVLATTLSQAPVVFRPDALLRRGDCRAEAGDLAVWVDLQKELWEIRDALLEGLALDSRGPAQAA